MATSEDLVPTGGDYGDRQATVAGMRQAGVPTSSEDAGEPPGVPPAPAAPPAPSARPDPAQGPVGAGDVLAGRSPSQPPLSGLMLPGEPVAVTFRDRLAASENPMLQEIAALMGDYLSAE